MSRHKGSRSAILATMLTLLAPSAHAAWSLTGNPLCNVPGDLFPPVPFRGPFVSFGSGVSGSLSVYWQDTRTDAGDIYSSGVSDYPPPDPAPGTPGTPVVTGPGVQVPGGAVMVLPVLCGIQWGCHVRVFVWSDTPESGPSRARAMRSFDQGADWGAGGLEVATGADSQVDPVVASDGGEGVIVAWRNVNAEHSWVFAQHLDGHGVAQWGASGVPVGTDTTVQEAPQIASDGAGGAWILRFDRRGGQVTLALFRLGPDGAPAAGWSATGVVLGTAPQLSPAPLLRATPSGAWVVWSELATLSDESTAPRPLATLISSSGAAQSGFSALGQPVAPSLEGSVIATDAAVSYESDIVIACEYTQLVPGPAPSGTDLRAFHTLVNGEPAPSWPASGVVVCDEPGAQQQARVSYSGAWAMFAWSDRRSGEGDIYAQMLRQDASRAPEWPEAGLAVCTVAGEQRDPVIGPNAVGGGFIIWRDGRDLATNGWDLYGQTVSYDARLDSEPMLPRAFALAAARPNPARQRAHFRLSLPEACNVRFDVLDVAGRFVHREAITLPAGERLLAWDLTSDRGLRVRPGLYLVHVRAGSHQATSRVIVTE